MHYFYKSIDTDELKYIVKMMKRFHRDADSDCESTFGWIDKYFHEHGYLYAESEYAEVCTEGYVAGKMEENPAGYIIIEDKKEFMKLIIKQKMLPEKK